MSLVLLPKRGEQFDNDRISYSEPFEHLLKLGTVALDACHFLVVDIVN